MLGGEAAKIPAGMTKDQKVSGQKDRNRGGLTRDRQGQKAGDKTNKEGNRQTIRDRTEPKEAAEVERLIR